MLHKIPLLLLKGCQDINIEKQVITPSVVRISDKTEDKFSEQGDLLKIKGFITNVNNIPKLKKLYLSIEFNYETYKIPFSFLLNYNNNVTKISNYERKEESEHYYESKHYDNYFIRFPQDVLLTHKIPLIALQFSRFTVSIERLDENTIVDMVLDTYVLDIVRRKEVATTDKTYNIKSIYDFKINLIGSAYEPYSFCDYESIIIPQFLTQGIIIKFPKQKIISILITLNDTIKCLDYDNNLINIYGEDIGENLSYFGFNIEEKFTSNNLIGCINMSILNKVNVKIRILNNDEEPKLSGNDPLEIYTVSWNEIKYKSGLCGFTFG
jgi:hypothetical protein